MQFFRLTKTHVISIWICYESLRIFVKKLSVQKMATLHYLYNWPLLQNHNEGKGIYDIYVGSFFNLKNLVL